MKTTPTGFQITFLLFAMAFAAMLATTWLARVLGVPDAHYGTLGTFVQIPFEFGLVLGLPALRELVIEGLRKPVPVPVRLEAISLAGAKVVLTFGVWGAVALWGIHVAHRSDDLGVYGFVLDPTQMDQRYFSQWGLVAALYAISLGPFLEEILYRGVLYRLWEKQWGWIAATLLSSVVFSIIHPHNLIQTFLSAILYGCLFNRTGSIWATTLCHATYNILVAWPLLGHVLRVKPPEAATSFDPWIPNLVCLAVGSIAFVAYIVLAARKPAPEH